MFSVSVIVQHGGFQFGVLKRLLYRFTNVFCLGLGGVLLHKHCFGASILAAVLSA